ncbi:hypothetical protein GUITHDRAFT_161970 [Guillardia theta CCMP2712]|uniref:Uncharacterized protein n=2 Tax=Guillardia theta TaxID=55529 RepID=L1JMT2_GUITC|nr:hypothetical protein GUITHDRAFT_161970 [Guillardia theta CCMP2712]EKX49896.1 hypothetical protein GUITHDRAFT_161970 [Guillardia theta CCMP2712]|eukprot:XP_005836876.1 hypothetical protein GUITHDRAFT_161970 [Guillardia theta CCMP2712]
MKALSVVLVCGVLLVVGWKSASQSYRTTSLMSDEGLSAMTIGMDHNAMLARNPTQNAAYMQTFGSFLPNANLKSATGTTQLAQAKHTAQRKMKASAQSRLNQKLAAAMQAKLTASSRGDELMTPHFVAALDAASKMGSRTSMLSERKQKEALDALNMANSKSHILPSKLREEYNFNTAKQTLGQTKLISPSQAALRAYPQGDATQSLSQRAVPSATGGNPGLAGKADQQFLSSEPQQLSTKELIQQAAMKQLNSLPKQSAAAPVQQLAEQPPVARPYAYPVAAVAQPTMYYQQAPQPMAYSSYPAQVPNNQMAYQPQQMYQPSYPQAPMQQQYAPMQQPVYAQPLQQRPMAYQPYNGMAQQTQMAYQSSATPQYASSNAMMTPAEIGKAAAANAASWRAPDESLKAGKSKHLSAQQKQKIREQMEALRQSIKSDFKANTRMADKALLLGPGGL